MRVFKTAQDAFEATYYDLCYHATQVGNTHVLYNYGFTIKYPTDNLIKTKGRKWSKDYANAEWQWYLSESPFISTLKELNDGFIPAIWLNIQDNAGRVNSNYGYQWARGINMPQIDYVIEELRNNPDSRRAVISIYDGKESHKYRKDTPCTLAIHFQLLNNRLKMTVMMRSNDIWFGFCNDQYCFSMLQQRIAKVLNVKVGTYTHFTSNMHVYDTHYRRFKTPYNYLDDASYESYAANKK